MKVDFIEVSCECLKAQLVSIWEGSLEISISLSQLLRKGLKGFDIILHMIIHSSL